MIISMIIIIIGVIIIIIIITVIIINNNITIITISILNVAGTPDRETLPADGQILSRSRTRRLRRRPGADAPGRSTGFQVRLAFRSSTLVDTSTRPWQPDRAHSGRERKPLRPHPAYEFQGIPGQSPSQQFPAQDVVHVYPRVRWPGHLF